MPQIQLPSARISYAFEGSGPLLVLLHANPGDSRDFDGILPALAEQYRVLLVDWPGYGESAPLPDPDSASVMLFYRIWCELAAALALEPALFIGNSVGGYVAARYAIDAPAQVRGLVLVAPGGFTPHNLLTRSFCRVQGSLLAAPPMVLARLYLRRSTDITREMHLRARFEQSTPAARAVNRAIWRSFVAPEHDLRPLAADIMQPTLLMFGKYDPLIPAGKDGKLAASLISQASLVVTRTGHAPFAEAPADFLQLVLPFLAQIDSEAD
jgi:pimeloyl-ACP methyl ester carboxylesterase